MADQPIGQVSLTEADHEDDAARVWQSQMGGFLEDIAVVVRLFVDPRHRRNGAAQELMRAAYEHATRLRKQLLFDVMLKGVRAIRLYETLGCERLGSLPTTTERAWKSQQPSTSDHTTSTRGTTDPYAKRSATAIRLLATGNQKAMTGFSPYSLPFRGAALRACSHVWQIRRTWRSTRHTWTTHGRRDALTSAVDELLARKPPDESPALRGHRPARQPRHVNPSTSPGCCVGGALCRRRSLQETNALSQRDDVVDCYYRLA